MRIGGWVPISLCDYPGRVASVVFTQGCNFRCPYCHNRALLPCVRDAQQLLDPELLLSKLHQRRQQISAVVVSGGEPTLQPELPAFLTSLKSQGLAVKLDSNGSRPELLAELIQGELIDFIAMDLKASFAEYSQLAGVLVDTRRVQRSLELIASSGLEHEFRTTVVPGLHQPGEVARCRALVPTGSPYRTQVFRPAPSLDLPAEPELGTEAAGRRS